jgi:hypothetical protein
MLADLPVGTVTPAAGRSIGSGWKFIIIITRLASK